MNENINVSVNGAEPKPFPKGISLMELARESYDDASICQILAAEVDGEVMELSTHLQDDAVVSFLDITDKNGFRIYQRSAAFLMIFAVQEVLGKGTRVAVEYSIGKNYVCEIRNGGSKFPSLEGCPQGGVVTDEIIEQIDARMRKAVAEAMPIEKVRVTVGEAIKIAEELNQFDKVSILKHRSAESVKLYKLGWYHDYFYGSMAINVACIDRFKLHRMSDNGFLLQFPSGLEGGDLPVPLSRKKVADVFVESGRWARILGVDTVGALNDHICQSGIESVIRIAEALHEKKVANIADMVTEQGRRIVLIAGPSSSGKTTLASRLRVHLKVNGMRTHVISLDDYYLDRDKVVRESDGSINLEKIEAIDVAQINADLAGLLRGETVEIPHFNFRTKLREYNGRTIRMQDNDVIIMEGIHGLNEKIAEQVEKSVKFKIFISALTQLNIDYHNRIPTTDTRLIRRLVRDFKHRGATVERTIGMWPTVMRGEENYIFPFQEEADVFFNSALVYEMCILKPYVTPLLLNVDRSSTAFGEARRLLRFLDSFIAQSSEQIPPNSILREFIGGGWVY